MDKFFETIITQLFKELYGEGERRIKLQALSAGLELVKGTRRVLIVLILFCFACFLSAISFFSTASVLFDQLQAGQWNFHAPRLLFSLSIFLISTGLLWLTVREKKWLAAFRLKERIQDLEGTPTPAQSPVNQVITEEMIAKLIDQALEKKLKPEPSSSS